jgi:hypothetical protein
MQINLDNALGMTISASGALFEYNNTIYLDECQLGSGISAHDFRMSQNLAQVRGVAKYDEESVSKLGAVSEVPLCVAYGLPFDVYVGAGKDFSYNGFDGDIKASAIYPNLLVNIRLYHPEWLYVHTLQVSEREYQLVGWLFGKEVEERYDKIITNGRPPAYRVRAEKLRPFRKLIGKRIE